jgi:hypothetical protein
MNFSEVFQTLNQASAFDLFRLRAAIDRALDEPRWLQAIQTRLKVRRKEVVVLDLEDAERWVLSYAAINLDGADVQIREQKPQGLGRNEVALGDVVGFVGRDQQQRTGKIIRLNDKTVTLQCDQSQWRVAYSFLHRVVDVDSAVHEVAELSAARVPGIQG